MTGMDPGWAGGQGQRWAEYPQRSFAADLDTALLSSGRIEMAEHEHWPAEPIRWRGRDQTAICRCGSPIRMLDADSSRHGPWELDPAPATASLPNRKD